MRLYALDEACAEAIFAPFHDPVVSPTIPIRLHAETGSNCRYEHSWDATHLYWDSSAAGQLACRLEVAVDLRDLAYTHFLFCVTFAEPIQLDFETHLDGRWRRLIAPVTGRLSRQELTAAIPAGQLTKLRMNCVSLDGRRAIVRLHWFGLADVELLARTCKHRPWQDVVWGGLIAPEKHWDSRRFSRGLVFSDRDLDTLRHKKRLPYWSQHFAALELQATEFLQRCPEEDLGLYLPWLDERYIRERERGRESYFWQPLTLATVGLVNDDLGMIRQAARYLMCMIHTVHWCQSAESRAVGSTWNQRCFMEEMAATSVALLADWLDFCLTDQARTLIRQALWEKGLAVIERDMMRCEEVHRINQAVWFCRGRILGGLLLEQSWPHVGQYVDRACHDLRNTLDRYIKPDGGVEEGMGYFCLTLSFALQGLHAYARARGVSLRSLLPKHIDRAEDFLAVMSAVEPGRLLMDGDNSTDRMPFDAIALLASLFPESKYSQVLALSLLPDERPFTYFDHYDARGIFAFLLGPSEVQPARSIVPEFRNLPVVGMLSSFRQLGGRSLRIHLSGACAFPSHAHFDRGAFTVEADGQRMLIDRGIVRYDHPACFSLKRTCMHNALTPMLQDGSFPDQATCEQATLPAGSGDRISLHASIDISHVWRHYMRACHRTILSTSCNDLAIIDQGELLHPGRIAFHLHSPFAFQIDGARVLLTHDRIAFSIHADWCEEIFSSEDSIDYRMEPAFHLILISKPVSKFALETRLDRL